MGYGRPMKPFSLKSRNFGQINFGTFGVFSAGELSAPILAFWDSESFVHVFHSTIKFLQKTKPLYRHSKYVFILDWDLNLNLGRKLLGI